MGAVSFTARAVPRITLSRDHSITFVCVLAGLVVVLRRFIAELHGDRSGSSTRTAGRGGRVTRARRAWPPTNSREPDSRRSGRASTNRRGRIVLPLLRALAVTAIVVALARPMAVTRLGAPRKRAVFVLDRSLSIPGREAAGATGAAVALVPFARRAVATEATGEGFDRAVDAADFKATRDGTNLEAALAEARAQVFRKDRQQPIGTAGAAMTVSPEFAPRFLAIAGILAWILVLDPHLLHLQG